MVYFHPHQTIYWVLASCDWEHYHRRRDRSHQDINVSSITSKTGLSSRRQNQNTKGSKSYQWMVLHNMKPAVKSLISLFLSLCQRYLGLALWCQTMQTCWGFKHVREIKTKEFNIFNRLPAQSLRCFKAPLRCVYAKLTYAPATCFHREIRHTQTCRGISRVCAQVIAHWCKNFCVEYTPSI